MSKSIFILLLILIAGGNVVAQDLDFRQIKNPNVEYVQSEKIKKNPIPSIVFERGGLASEAERNEIIAKIVYPIINTSKEPIVAIVIEFLPGKKDEIILSVILREGVSIGGLVRKNKDGHFDAANDYWSSFEDQGCDDREN